MIVLVSSVPNKFFNSTSNSAAITRNLLVSYSIKHVIQEKVTLIK